MAKNMDQPIEKKQYKGKKNSDLVNFPVALRRNLFSPSVSDEVLEMPIVSARIIFKVLNDISYDQFVPSKEPVQLDLFDSEFKTEHNSVASFTFNINDIDPSNRNYNSIKIGLEFLENYQKRWYKSVNSKGKTIKSYGGFITHPNISEGKISFLISSYWLEKILSLNIYNPSYFITPWKLSNIRQVLFYLWLLELKDTGTKVNFNKLQNSYNYNYKTNKDFCKFFLKPLKMKLDKFSKRSFNYSIKGELINIMPYETKSVELNLEETTISKQTITQKLHYWKTRHKLSSNDIDVLKSFINIDSTTFRLFCDSYKDIIKTCRVEKKPVTEYQGEDFMKLFQESIIEAYKNSAWYHTSPNGHPQIIEIE